MFEEYDKPLPDVEKFLERIGLSGFKAENTIEFLDILVRAFLSHVPYENLEVSYEKKIPDLSAKGLYDKFVTRRRGGYCFEMNGAFRLLLKDLGFNVYSVSSYVLEDKDEMGDLGHRANIVEVDGKKYITDVGFGGRSTAYCAVPLDGSVKEDFFVKYDPEKREYTLCRILDMEDEKKRGTERFLIRGNVNGKDIFYKKIILFRDFIAYPQEFYLPNVAVFYLEDNPMINRYIANFCNEKGEIFTLCGDEFRGKSASGDIYKKIRSDKELKDILAEYYGIII